MHAHVDFCVFRRRSGGQSDDRVPVDAVGLVSHAFGRNRPDRGSGGRAVRREIPFDQEEHLRMDPGRGDGGSGQRRVPDGAVLHHPPGSHRTLHRAPRDRKPGGGGRGRGRGALGQPARTVSVPRSRRRRPRSFPRGQKQEAENGKGWERVSSRRDQHFGGQPQQSQ